MTSHCTCAQQLCDFDGDCSDDGKRCVLTSSTLLLQGFQDWRMMEDVDMVHRLNKLSAPLIMPLSMCTSGRRYQRVGFAQNIAFNNIIMLGWAAGVDHLQLTKLYEAVGGHCRGS